MEKIHYTDAIHEVLRTTNALVIEYVRSSNANFLLKAIEVQADAIQALQSILMNIEEGRNKPCPN